MEVRPQQSPRAVLSRSEPINFMSAKGCIGVADYGTVDDYIDIVGWIVSIAVSNSHSTRLPIRPKAQY